MNFKEFFKENYKNLDEEYFQYIRKDDYDNLEKLIELTAEKKGFNILAFRTGNYQNGIPTLPDTGGNFGSGYYFVEADSESTLDVVARFTPKTINGADTKTHWLYIHGPLFELNSLNDFQTYLNNNFEKWKKLYINWQERHSLTSDYYTKHNIKKSKEYYPNREDEAFAIKKTFFLNNDETYEQRKKNAIQWNPNISDDDINIAAKFTTIDTGLLFSFGHYLFRKEILPFKGFRFDWSKAKLTERNFTEICVSDPKWFKSASILSYKDKNIIPLTKRFDIRNPDYRF